LSNASSASRSLEDVDSIVAALGEGTKVVIFPEGTFSREAGPQAVSHGCFRRRRAGRGTGAGQRSARHARGSTGSDLDAAARSLRYEFGPLLSPDGSDWAAAVRLRERTRREMLRLCGEHDLER
jgi:1-acyl-sn-glycerol-3-phosphate acyltransferase